MSIETSSVIHRQAIRLRFAVFALIFVVVALYLAAALNLQIGHSHVEYRGRHLGASPEQLVSGGSIVMLAVALLRLAQMLGLIAAGELFTATVIRRFRGFAFWLLLMSLFQLVVPAVFGLAAAGRSLPHKFMMIVDLRDLLTVGITLLLFLLARLLEQAGRIDQENREFV